MLDFPRMKRRNGFTLLEILLAVTLIAVMLSLAVPSLGGLFRAQKLHKTFDSFDEFVREARMRGITERRDTLLVWEADGSIEAVAQEGAETGTAPERFTPAGKLTLERIQPLVKQPPGAWMIWRGGTCEPVIVHYKGAEGMWTARYDALTGRGSLIEESSK